MADDDTQTTDDEIAGELASSPTTNPDLGTVDPGRWSDVISPELHQAVAETPHPAEAPPAIPDKVSVKVSTKGFAPDQGQAALRKKGDDDLVQADKQLQADRDAAMAESRQGYEALSRAQDERARVEGQKSDAEAALLEHKQSALKDFAELYKTMSAEVEAAGAQHLQQYQTQMAAARQLTIQSPVAMLNGPEAAGLSLAMFSQGMLAAQGIHIDVGGQIDRWVAQSVKEQEFNIGQKEKAAEDQLNMWRIAQETSRNKLEALQRYKGMVMESIGVGLDLNAARFSAPLAQSAATVAKAQLQIEQTNNARTIRESYEREHLGLLKEAHADYHARVMEGFKSQELQIARDKAAAAAKAKPGNINFSDPEYAKDANGKEILINGNRVLENKWRMDPTLPKEIASKVFEKADTARTQYANYLDTTNRMMGSYAAAIAAKNALPGGPALTWDAADRLDKSGAIHRFVQDRNEWVNVKLYNDSGKAINETEQQRHDAMAYLDKVLAFNGDKTEKSQASLREYGRQKFERNMEGAGLQRIGKGDAEQYQISTTASPVAKNEDNATLNGKPAAPTAVSEQVQFLGAKDQGDDAGKASKPFAAFDREEGSKFATGATFSGEGRHTEMHEPRWVQHMDMIALGAVNPQVLINMHQSGALTNGRPPESVDQTPDQIKADAVEALRKASYDETLSEGQRAYAMHLRTLIKDPKKAAEELAGEAP
jgi:hypothetical protein